MQRANQTYKYDAAALPAVCLRLRKLGLVLRRP